MNLLLEHFLQTHVVAVSHKVAHLQLEVMLLTSQAECFFEQARYLTEKAEEKIADLQFVIDNQ